VAAPWRRDSYVTGGGAAEVALIALSSAKLPDPLPVSRVRHGMPDDGDGAGSVALVARDRVEDPAWFADHVLAPFTELIAADLGPGAAAAALAAEHAYVIEAQLDDPDDLGHVQAVWALAKCVCEEGAAVVIDVHAARAHLGSEIARLAPDRAETAAGPGRIGGTPGIRQFGFARYRARPLPSVPSRKGREDSSRTNAFVWQVDASAVAWYRSAACPSPQRRSRHWHRSSFPSLTSTASRSW
jgi:hypothetical protein